MRVSCIKRKLPKKNSHIFTIFSWKWLESCALRRMRKKNHLMTTTNSGRHLQSSQNWILRTDYGVAINAIFWGFPGTFFKNQCAKGMQGLQQKWTKEGHVLLFRALWCGLMRHSVLPYLPHKGPLLKDGCARRGS